MKNKMEEVAKLLGVELDEEFNIGGYKHNPYILTRRGLFDRDCDATRQFVLQKLLLGEVEIVKPLLTKEEKDFLENLLRQYKEDVPFIELRNNGDIYLYIEIERDDNYDGFCLPNITKHDLQFSRLDAYERYTLKDLGLFEEEENNG